MKFDLPNDLALATPTRGMADLWAVGHIPNGALQAFGNALLALTRWRRLGLHLGGTHAHFVQQLSTLESLQTSNYWLATVKNWA